MMSAAKPKFRVIRWLPPAEKSLMGIVDFIADDNPEAAVIFAGQVRSAVASLVRCRIGRAQVAWRPRVSSWCIPITSWCIASRPRPSISFAFDCGAGAVSAPELIR